MKELWRHCKTCQNTCCKWKDIVSPLFLTEKEKKKLPNINNNYPCIYYKNELCEIHAKRPIDCRLYPFDILKINNDFFWIFWKMPCPILNKKKEQIELYLLEHEKNLLNMLKNYIDDYSKFKFDELIYKYEFVVLRKINFSNSSYNPRKQA